MPFVVGLTGGIGSGKSTVASCFQEHGAVVVDADEISRELTAKGSPVLVELQQNFGSDILDQDGNLIRTLLAERAFASAERTAVLNKIMHGKIRGKAIELIGEMPSQTVVIYDMPLLVETGSQDMCDLVVVVDTDVDQQVNRLVELRGLTENDVRMRIERQAPREVRLESADLVISNNGSRADLAAECETAWDRILEQAAHGPRRSLSL